MHRYLQITLAALLPAALLAGCGDDDPTTDAGRAAPATSAPAGTGETIPDGTYSKTATAAEAKALGITDRGLLSELGEDGVTTYAYRFSGNRWTVFLIEEGAAPDPGDDGTMAYDENGDVELTSESEGCPGCTYVYDWQLQGNQLTLTIVGHEASSSPEDVAIARFVTEGVFVRRS